MTRLRGPARDARRPDAAPDAGDRRLRHGRAGHAGRRVVGQQADRRRRADGRASASAILAGRARVLGGRPARAARRRRPDARRAAGSTASGRRRAPRRRGCARSATSRSRSWTPGCARRRRRWRSSTCAAGGCGGRSSCSPPATTRRASRGWTRPGADRGRHPGRGRGAADRRGVETPVAFGMSGSRSCDGRRVDRGAAPAARARGEVEALRAELDRHEREAASRVPARSATPPTCARPSSRSATRAQELKRSYRATVRALANAVEARDAYTGRHAERVAAYGLEIAARGRHRARRQPGDGVRLPAARRRQGRRPGRDPVQARPADRARSTR